MLTSFDVDALLVQLRERLLGQARRAIALEAAARHRLAPPRQPFGGPDQVDV
ncbi:MAG TPA: hypothetical protein VES79_02425 [Solirubrobacteraceae bacterium]|nr:hypothetical protein [Solirubrobacteraceae bacterium]